MSAATDRNSAMRSVRSANGVPVRSVKVDGGNGQLLVAYGDDVQLQVRQRWFAESATPPTPVTTDALEKVRDLRLPNPGVSWLERASAAKLLFESTWRQSGSELEFSVRISNPGTEPAALCLEQNISGLPLRGMCFAPSLRADYDLKQSGAAFAYRGAPCLSKGLPGGVLSIPMVSFYERERDLGFTVAAHIEAPTPGFSCEAGTEQVTLQRRLRVSPGNSVTLRHFVIRHEGCWRPGLRWVRDAYPDYFMASAATVEATHGCFVYTNTTDVALCDELAQQGVKNVEIHWTCPFFGKSVPEEEPWVKMIDDKWNTIKRTTDPAAPPEDAPYDDIKRYVSRVTTPAGRCDEVRDFIRNLKARGMQTYMYFNPTESWEFFAAQEFPECIVRRPDGSPCMTWFDHVVMDCRPDSRWGQYLCDEVQRLLELYPEADGIFMDQSAGDPDDFKVCRITHAVAKIVERAGKTCYWNGPYMVDLLPHTVGLLGELGPLQGERIKWLTVGSKVCCGLGHTEAQYQRNLLNGLWPPAPSLIHSRGFRVSDAPAHAKPIPEELQRLHRNYMLLYERLPGKTWFLGPNPLDVPEGVQGNIFESRDGEYLVPLIVPGHDVAKGAFAKNVVVSVRVPDAEHIRGACVQSINLPGGSYRVPFQRRGGELRVTIPWLGAASLLRLTHEECSGDEMPEARDCSVRTEKPPPRVICTVIHAEGVAPTGNLDSIENGLTTTAPLPPVPIRKAYLNGTQMGTLGSVNSWHWHPLVGVGVIQNIKVDITDILRRENELVIEPDGPQDFFKMRSISMLVVFSDGRVFHSKSERNTYSSCAHAQAEGIIQSPVQIPIEFSELPE
ncbi:MAG: hypothetical protein A3K19_01350 [Lentisphaerae bacterium RIFOXYB12_FULL_65_16]|nr:MAG: hypothetical protein A3K18_06230 [Lentisphaerae bacterium RIFOXYA12_64_32]OGV92543.1 MAG: hypothetical protein A3K19_01350 [Lentisphaerae bacterium RIFOXYB12_FULL_65_16]